MQSFVQWMPTEVVFGKGAQEKTADEIRKFGGTRVFVVYGGGSVVKSGLLGEIEEQLKEAGLHYELYGGVKPNPRLAHAEEGVKKAVSFGADFLLAVGGGSVIDTAKAIAHGTASPDIPIWDYWEGRRKVEKSLPVGCVLTISAAGSETSDSSVLTDERTGRKKGLGTDFNRPAFAVMNPELTYTLPQYQISCGIVDIMMHTMDRYFTCTRGNELSDAFAEGLLRTVIRNGRKALQNPRDYDAMSEIMWCGSVSHNGMTGLGGQKDFAPHKIGHELSGKYDVAHGASLSTIWGSWAKYVRESDPARFAAFGRRVWGIEDDDDETASKAAIEAAVSYFRSLGMPVSFTELGIGVRPEDELQEMAASATADDRIVIGCFKELHERDLVEIYKLANH